MNRPKILITNFHTYLGGGHDTFINSLATNSLKNAFEFALAVPKTSFLFQLATENGIQVFPCDFPSNIKEFFHTLRSIKRFKDICTEYKPQIIHTNGGADNDIVAWSLFFQKKNFQILRTHHAVREMPGDPYHQWLYRWIVNGNVYVSPSAKDMSQSEKSLKLPNAIVIENGVDTNFFEPREKDASLKMKLGIPDDYFVFGSCAGTSGYKRIDIMFEAAKALKDSYKFKILILGQDPDREHILNMDTSQGIKDSVIYGGFQKDIRPYCSIFRCWFCFE